MCNNDNVGNNQYHTDILYSNQGQPDYTKHAA